VRRLVRLAAGAALALAAQWAPVRVAAQQAPTVPVPTPQAGRGAAARADAAAEEDARASARLTDAALGAAGTQGGGPPEPTAADLATAGAVRVYLMTIGQGDVVWERFGHNAIRVVDPSRGTDLAYNWGIFDFNQPNFIGRFLTGDTRYSMEPIDAPSLAHYYATEENRTVVQQELNLTSAQKARLRAFVEWNALEANKYYRYDYYNDNCSTRVRDALDLALGGALRRTIVGRPTNTTFRSHTRRLLAGDVPTYTGIQLALGRPADVPIDAWAESFLPGRLAEYARGVRVNTGGGAQSLVLREDTLFAARREPERASAPSYAIGYLVAGLALGALLVLLGRRGAAGARGADAGFGVLAGVYVLIVGLAGTALVLAGTVTRHTYMGRNENLLAANPVALVLLVLLLVAVGVRRPEARARWRARAAVVAAVLALCTVLGAVLTLLPGIGQRSTELFALLVPAHLAIWWALRTPVAGAATRAAVSDA
jgi:hypothetical protein